MKINSPALLFSIAIIIAAIFLGNAYRNRGKIDNTISVTGLGEQDFSSDLIVWEGSFSQLNMDMKQAYADLEKDRRIIEEYLLANGIAVNDVVFSAVQSFQSNKSKYSADGRYIGEEFVGYELTQRIQISSKEVEKVEQLSRSITELLNKGIQLYSEPPRYYYTKLSDLKLELISKATEDARLRAEMISKQSGSRIGKLKQAQMGIFQITAVNSTEEFSWGGTFNTTSKEKTASITMKLTYIIK
jgi:hypothetical protein